MIVTVEQLAAVIEAMQGAQPATMTTRTDANLLKTGNTLGEVVKYSKVNVFVGVNYENDVKRQQVREGAEEGTFEAQAPKWGERIGKKLISHKGNLYCPVKIGSAIEQPRYVQVSTHDVLSNEVVAPFKQKKQSSAAAQGVDKEIVWRTYNLSNILRLTIGGDTYIVVGSPAVEAARRELPVEQVEVVAEPVN